MKTKMKLAVRGLFLNPRLPQIAVMAIVLTTVLLLSSQTAFASTQASEMAKKGLGLIYTIIKIFCIIAGIALAALGIYNIAVGKAMEEGPRMNKGIAMLAGAVALLIAPAIIKTFMGNFSSDIGTLGDPDDPFAG